MKKKIKEAMLDKIAHVGSVPTAIITGLVMYPIVEQSLYDTATGHTLIVYRRSRFWLWRRSVKHCRYRRIPLLLAAFVALKWSWRVVWRVHYIEDIIALTPILVTIGLFAGVMAALNKFSAATPGKAQEKGDGKP